MKRRFFRFGYPCPVRPPKDPGAFQIRDGAAFTELSEPLREAGWSFETLICNYPYFEGAGGVVLGRECFDFLKPEDCLVQTTRPPLHDEREDNRKKIPRSRSHLEGVLFTELSVYFRHICRERIEFSDTLVDLLAAGGNHSRGEVVSRYHFRQTHDARIARKGFADSRRRDRVVNPLDYRSLGVFLHLPSIRDYGCRFIASFGMGGFETLVWNAIIRKRHPGWVDEPRLVLAEMDLNGVPERPVTLHFAERVTLRLLLDAPIAAGGPGKTPVRELALAGGKGKDR